AVPPQLNPGSVFGDQGMPEQLRIAADPGCGTDPQGQQEWRQRLTLAQPPGAEIISAPVADDASLGEILPVLCLGKRQSADVLEQRLFLLPGEEIAFIPEACGECAAEARKEEPLSHRPFMRANRAPSMETGRPNG